MLLSEYNYDIVFHVYINVMATCNVNFSWPNPFHIDTFCIYFPDYLSDLNCAEMNKNKN